MGQSQNSVFPQTARDDASERRRQAWAPVTEWVAGWSARHRKTAIFGWLLLVAAVCMAGQTIGAKNQPQYDYGQAGQAERVLSQAAPQFSADTGDVPIQARAPGVTVTNDATMRRAAGQAASALILSRISELFAGGSSAREAIAGGIAASAGVVTGAALIMVVVFSTFVTMPLIELKMLGAGMAAAVLIDATVARGVPLLAALLAVLPLLGDRAWRLRRRAVPVLLAGVQVGAEAAPRTYAGESFDGPRYAVAAEQQARPPAQVPCLGTLAVGKRDDGPRGQVEPGFYDAVIAKGDAQS